MQSNEALIYILTKIYNKTEQEILSQIFKDGEIDPEIVLTEITKRIEKNKNENEKKFDDGYGKGKGESLKIFENAIKEKYGIQSDLKGLELIDHVVSEKINSPIEEDKIKISKPYLTLEEKIKTGYVLKTEYDTIKKEYDNYRINNVKNQTFDGIKNKVWDKLKEWNVVFPSDPVRAKTYENAFLNDLKNFDYETPEGSMEPIIIKDGKRLEDALGNTTKFEEHIKNIASRWYEFSQQPLRASPKSNIGNPDGNLFIPKDDIELFETLKNITDPKEKSKIFLAYNTAKGIDVKNYM
jgi:hypothetical protein